MDLRVSFNGDPLISSFYFFIQNPQSTIHKHRGSWMTKTCQSISCGPSKLDLQNAKNIAKSIKQAQSCP